MRPISACRFRPAAVFGWAVWVVLPLVLPSAVRSAEGDKPSGVHDNARLFTADAARAAEDVIRQIKRDHDRHVLVETYPAIDGAPAGEGKEKERNQFFTDRMVERGRALGVRGMMVLVVMDPPHVQVYVGATTTGLFKRADQEALTRKLAEVMRDKRFDDGLLKVVGFVKDCMDHGDPKAGPGPGPAAGATPAPHGPADPRAAAA